MSRSRIALAATLVAAAYWLLLFIGTHLPPWLDPTPGGNAPDDHRDKLLHCLAFAGLAFLLCTAGALRFGFRRRLLALVLVGLMAYAALDEWSQQFVGRDTQEEDWGADVLGIGLGLATFSLLVEPMLGLVPPLPVSREEPGRTSDFVA